MALVMSGMFVSNEAFAQTFINVNSTGVCFLNASAGYHMLQNCHARDDWLNFSLLWVEWITGGYFSVALVSVFILVTYLKYHKAIYPIMIGMLFMPVAYTFFPANWINFAIVLATLGIIIMIFKTFMKNTKEW